MLIPEESPLRNPPRELSRKQILILDGIRFAAEIADVAYQRLAKNLLSIAPSSLNLSASQIAMAIADAWTIVDSVNRFHNLTENMPGLRNAAWRKLLNNRTKDFIDLRDCIQHQLSELDNLMINAGQIWGYLSWAEVLGGRYTGKWLMLSPGTYYVDDQWFFGGPVKRLFHVPLGRIRLNAFGRQVYLGQGVHALLDAIASLSADLTNGNVRSVGTPAANRRGADMMFEGWIMVDYTLDATKKNSPLDNGGADNS